MISIIEFILNSAVSVECVIYKIIIIVDYNINTNCGISIISVYNNIYDNLYNTYLFLNDTEIIRLLKYIENYFTFDAVVVDPKIINLMRVYKISLILMYITYIYFILFSLFFINILFNYRISNVISIFINFFKNESENNISNFIDIRNMIIIFITTLLLYVFNSYFNDSLFRYVSSIYFSLFLNIITLFIYLFIFSSNAFIYIKGLYSKFKLTLLLIDSISITIFITRLLLQLLRLLICVFIFFLIHEMSFFLLDFLIQFDNQNTLNIYNSDSIQYTLGVCIKTIIEYLDMFVNSSTQFSIYIISIMWLIPYLFTFVKKIYKYVVKKN